MSHNLGKVIVSRTDHIGDVVLALPVFASLKKCFPERRAIALVSNYTADVVRSSPFVDDVITYDPNESIFLTWKKLKKIEANAIVILFPRFKIAAASFLAGIPVRIGTAYRLYSFLLNRRIREHRKYSVKSESEYNLTLVEVLGCKEKIFDTTLNINEAALDSIDVFLGKNCLTKFIVVHPGSGGSAFEWGPDNFRGIVKTITNDLGLNVVVTGTVQENLLCKNISEGIGNAINTAGRFSMLEFIALLSKAELFISNSTGPLHLAAAVGTPLIGIYPNGKPMAPVRWMPLTDKKIILVPKDGSNNLSLIPVGEVTEAVRKLMNIEPR
ncbi:MAG TPA: glycosyltransferase family 9 protein [Candidatus Acidoferrales bacterium]|nr:glycosyltransferase family 9 protein [Candidatus Acidoferrales bacterium]